MRSLILFAAILAACSADDPPRRVNHAEWFLRAMLSPSLQAECDRIDGMPWLADEATCKLYDLVVDGSATRRAPSSIAWCIAAIGAAPHCTMVVDFKPPTEKTPPTK